MSLLDSFFDALIRLDGDRLVIHVGQKPYVERTGSAFGGPVEWGHVELSSKPLTLKAAMAIVEQILPPDEFRSLSEIGVIEHELSPAHRPGEHFVVVVARGGEDVWVEVKRLPPPAPSVEETQFEPAVPPQPVPVAVEAPAPVVAEPPPPVVAEPMVAAGPEPVAPPVVEPAIPAFAETAPPPEAEWAAVVLEPVVLESPRLAEPEPALVAAVPEPSPVAEPEAPAEVSEPPVIERPFVIVPISRPVPKPADAAPALGVERLLRAAADAGASSVHIAPGMGAMARINGVMRHLDAESVREQDIAQFIETHGITIDETWEGELRDVGHIHCQAVDDYHGPALTVHFAQHGLLSADQLGLSAAVQGLADAADGLVLIAGPRRSGKSTLVHAFIDVVNKTRFDHVITIESRITFAHEAQHSFISQRQVGGDGEAFMEALRRALREGPDILVIDDLRALDAAAIALDAARAGRLVFATVAAPSADAAVERFVVSFPETRHAQVRSLLSAILRGVIAQALVKSAGGPMIAAREVRLRPGGTSGSIADTLVQLVRDGRVNAADALRVAPDREALSAALHREGFEIDGERLA